ncbi:MAG: hypothetical protein ACLGI9_04030 [Thermoanaerobaculia bacterium]
MEKKNEPKLKISELDVELISEEELKAAGAIQSVPESCGCRLASTDVWYC